MLPLPTPCTKQILLFVSSYHRSYRFWTAVPYSVKLLHDAPSVLVRHPKLVLVALYQAHQRPFAKKHFFWYGSVSGLAVVVVPTVLTIHFATNYYKLKKREKEKFSVS